MGNILFILSYIWTFIKILLYNNYMSRYQYQQVPPTSTSTPTSNNNQFYDKNIIDHNIINKPVRINQPIDNYRMAD